MRTLIPFAFVLACSTVTARRVYVALVAPSPYEWSCCVFCALMTLFLIAAVTRD